MVCDQRCDLNQDGVVDDQDKAIFSSAYGSKVGDSNWNPACDFNGNGEVDPFDMVHFGESFGCTFGVPTPPPSSITCNGATPHYSSGCAMLLAFDVNNDGKIDGGELAGAGTIKAAGRITADEYSFIESAYNAGSINSICPGCYGAAPPPTVITCAGATPHYSSGCKLLLAADRDNDGKVSSMDAMMMQQSGATTEEVNFILAAASAGSINALCPGCYGVPTPPVTPPENETRTISLTEGQHTIQVALSGYDTLTATINVSSTGVTCVSVIGGACGGSSLPRVSTSGWTVTTYLKEGAGATDRCTWIATKDTSKVVFISEMVLAYSDLMNIGFTPSASEIGQAVLMYSNLGTPETLWGC